MRANTPTRGRTQPKLLREITPLTNGDCFTVFYRTKKVFDFPLHYHDEFELNFIANASGAQRIIGDHIEEIGNLELVLVGPNLPHGWFNHKLKKGAITEITIQFHRDLFDEKFLQRNPMRPLQALFERSLRGILFSEEATLQIRPRLYKLIEKSGFDSVMELLCILHDLSNTRNMRTLSNTTSSSENLSYNSRRIERIMAYLNANFDKNITLADAAKIAGMTEVAVSRFFKLRTGKTFIDTLNETRIGHASRLLIDTTHSINEVAYRCGFNNISNFNRIFKAKKTCTPKAFRQAYHASGTRAFI